MMASGEDPDTNNGLTNEDLQDLHEDILDRNEDGVRSLLQEFLDQDLPIKELCCTEVELEPANQDHRLNWLPLTAIHRAALIDSHGILDAILSSVPDVNINLKLRKKHLTPLHLAASAGVLAAVNFLTSQNANVEAMDIDGGTPMHQAAEHNNKDVMSVLCVRGGSVNARDKQNRTPLHVAAEHGHVDIVDFLIGKDLKVKVKDVTGRTALHLAQVKGHAGITERLLDKGMAVDEVDDNGDTAVHVWIQHLKSMKNGHIDETTISTTSLEVLIHHGADINIANHCGDTSLHLASRVGNVAVLKLLLDHGAMIEAENSIGQTALFCAGSYDMCQVLLERSAGVDVMDYHGNTVLHVYAGSDDITCDMMDMVIRAGADLNGQNFHGATPLYFACEAGNRNKIELLLQNGAQMDIKDSYGRTVLHACLPKASDDVLMWLLGKNSINIMQQDADGVSLLHLAAQYGHRDIVDYLVNRNVDFNIETSRGKSAATMAAEHNHLDIVRTILLNGGSIDPEVGAKVLLVFVRNGDLDILKVLVNQADCNLAKDENGHTALHLGLAGNSLHISELLINSGADIEVQNLVNQTPLHTACQQLPDMEPVLADLVSYVTCCLKDKSGNTPLHYAIRECGMTTLELFGRNSFNVNTQNVQKQTIGHILLCPGSANSLGSHLLEKVKWLQNQDHFDINVLDQESNSLLHLAVRTCEAEVVSLLVDNEKLEVDIQDCDGRTPLHCACGLGLDKITQLLLQRGADPNIQDLKGLTPMFHAIQAKDLQTVCVLLAQGCDINIQDNEGRTALMVAMELQLSEISRKIILECSSDLDILDIHRQSPLHYACRYCSVDIVKELITQGAVVNARDQTKATPLHQAVLNPDAEVLQVLVTTGANKNAQDSAGNTPLHLCSERGSYDHVKMLIDCEADAEIQNNMEYTSLHMAAMATDSDVMQLLVANEADFDVIDCEGKTPLILSIIQGNTESSSLLLGQGADVSIQDDEGNSALHHAMRMNTLDIKFLKLLFHRGRKMIGCKNSRGQSVVDILRQRNDADVDNICQDIGLDL